MLLEASPADLDPEEIGTALAAHPHVVNVHDLHVWELTSGFPSLSAHVLVHPKDDCHAIRLDLERFLEERFHVEHTTLQVDHAPAEYLPGRAAGAGSRAISPLTVGRQASAAIAAHSAQTPSTAK